MAGNSSTNLEQLYSNQKFGSFYRINQFILRAKNETSEQDLFTKPYLEQVYFLQQRIEASSINFQGEKYTVNDLCFKPIENKGCMTTSPMDFWAMNLDKMKNDKEIKQTAKCLFNTEKLEMPCFDRNGIPIIIESIFGQQTCKGSSGGDDCTLCERSAKALSKLINIYNYIYIV